MINVVDKAMLDSHVIASADRICREINEENQDFAVRWCAEDFYIGHMASRLVVTMTFFAKPDVNWWTTMRVAPELIEDSGAAKAYLLGEINKWLESKKVQQP